MNGHEGHEMIALNAQLAARLGDMDQETHRLNDAMFVALNDVKQRLEEVIGGRDERAR